VRVLALAELDVDGTLGTALDARSSEVWVIRPDAHIAAVLTDPTVAEITAALCRAAARIAGPSRGPQG
jgi:pentachlorophenol monooxygenase/3-(3-hydroxy-phenyl)propionate hydroxylase